MVTVLALLLLVVVAGGFNYYRNLQLEQQSTRPRPFEAYATADLESLRAAYASEVEQFQARYTAQEARRQRASGQGLMDERVQEFERVQATSDRLRDLRADLAEREARLRELDEELTHRTGQLTGVKLHLQRLVTI